MFPGSYGSYGSLLWPLSISVQYSYRKSCHTGLRVNRQHRRHVDAAFKDRLFRRQFDGLSADRKSVVGQTLIPYCPFDTEGRQNWTRFECTQHVKSTRNNKRFCVDVLGKQTFNFSVCSFFWGEEQLYCNQREVCLHSNSSLKNIVCIIKAWHTF